MVGHKTWAEHSILSGVFFVEARMALVDVARVFVQKVPSIRGDAESQAIDKRIDQATEEDWSAEYLDKIISVKLVDSVEEAITHINRYGSNHTEAIITENDEAAEQFFHGIDSGIVLHNASTQFADGGEFGMGAEIGIATGKLHARGPVGAEQLTIYKYLVRGSGQTRP